MPLYPPRRFSGSSNPESGVNVLEHEMLAEMAASLGRAGERAALCLARLRQAPAESAEEKVLLLKEAAAAVHAYFIQRELCGLRRHDEVIRELQIPRQVLVRLGAV
jgi:flavin reductase (DIM6/NTAB) family NADH-FMN oxidoreductase RutF